MINSPMGLDFIYIEVEVNKMTIREWKQQAADLVNDFQFASDIPALEALLEAAKEIAAEESKN